MDFKMYLSIFIYCFGITGIHNLETRSAAVCYGNTHANYITISCNTTEVIMVRSVDAMTKLSSSGCPIEQIPADQDQDCCVEDPEDCGGRYTGSVYQSYFTKCHGKQTCRSLQASWMTLTDDTFPHCNTTIYLPRTNYMVYDYSCVPTTTIKSPCAGVQTTDTSVFLWNSNYPDQMSAGVDNQCSCSVDISCDSAIQVTAVDLRFASDSSGRCQQRIVITEGGVTTTLDCDRNNDFTHTTVYTSSTYFLTFAIENDLSASDGNFWIQISGTHSDAELTLGCGASQTTTLSNTTKPKCSIPTNANDTDSSGNNNNGTDSSGNNNNGTDSSGNNNNGTDSSGNNNNGTDSSGNNNNGTDSSGNNNNGTDSSGNNNNGTDGSGNNNNGTDSSGNNNNGTDTSGNDNNGTDSSGNNNGTDSSGNNNNGTDSSGNNNNGTYSSDNTNGTDSSGNNNGTDSSGNNNGTDSSGNNNNGTDSSGNNNNGTDSSGNNNNGTNSSGNNNNGTDSSGNNNGTDSSGNNNGTDSSGNNNGTDSSGNNNGTDSSGNNNGTDSSGNNNNGNNTSGNNNGTDSSGNKNGTDSSGNNNGTDSSGNTSNGTDSGGNNNGTDSSGNNNNGTSGNGSEGNGSNGNNPDVSDDTNSESNGESSGSGSDNNGDGGNVDNSTEQSESDSGVVVIAIVAVVVIIIIVVAVVLFVKRKEIKQKLCPSKLEAEEAKEDASPTPPLYDTMPSNPLFIPGAFPVIPSVAAGGTQYPGGGFVGRKPQLDPIPVNVFENVTSKSKPPKMPNTQGLKKSHLPPIEGTSGLQPIPKLNLLNMLMGETSWNQLPSAKEIESGGHAPIVKDGEPVNINEKEERKQRKSRRKKKKLIDRLNAVQGVYGNRDNVLK